MSASFLDANRDRKLEVATHDINSLDLSPEDGFVLSQVDGTLTFGELLHVLPFPAEDVAARVETLRAKGVLKFAGESADAGAKAAAAPESKPAPAAPAADEDPLADDWDGFEDISTTSSTTAPAKPASEPKPANKPTTPPPAAEAKPAPKPKPAPPPAAKPKPETPPAATPKPKANPAKPAATSGQPKPGESEEITRLRRRVRIQKRLHEKGDPFEMLGIKGGTRADEIRDAFHRLSRLFHPDRYFRLDLPEELKTDLEDLFGELQQAFDEVADPDDRKAALKAKLGHDRKRGGDADDDTATEDPARGGPKTADAESLAALADDALKHGQYGAARMNYKLAAQMDSRGGYENKAKLIELLEKVETRIHDLLDEETLPDADDVQHVEQTLAKIAPVIPDIARLLREFTVFLYLHGDDFQLLRNMYGRLRKLNAMPETLILGARIFIKGGMPQTALDLLDEAKAHEGSHPDIKRLRKEAKRRLSG